MDANPACGVPNKRRHSQALKNFGGSVAPYDKPVVWCSTHEKQEFNSIYLKIIKYYISTTTTTTSTLLHTSFIVDLVVQSAALEDFSYRA